MGSVVGHRPGAVTPLLASRLNQCLYALAWLVFTAGFAAVFWLQNPGRATSSLALSARIVAPAALLGILAIRLFEHVPVLPQPRLAQLLPLLVGGVAYPALWVGAVNVVNNVVALARGARTAWQLPPEHVLHWHFFAGCAIYAALAALTYGRILTQNAERERLVAEWKLLRGQLDPHFLFNTLHTIFGLAQLDPAQGEEMVARFSRLLRYVLLVHRDDTERVSLAAEWSFTEDYLQLQALRHDGVRWDTAISRDAATCGVPPLILQPLVENSVRHGRRAGSVCTIRFTAELRGSDLILCVSDDGVGAQRADVTRASGVGLRAVRTRVATLTPGGAFDVDTTPGSGFRVTVRLPVEPAPPMRHAIADVREVGA